MKIDQLKDEHPQIYDRALDCMWEDSGVQFDDCELEAAFIFSETDEGIDVWTEVNEGRFASFYKFHS